MGNSVGYLPHRADFEIEWENEAETVLGDMEYVLPSFLFFSLSLSLSLLLSVNSLLPFLFPHLF
jgi:hypothetical protein